MERPRPSPPVLPWLALLPTVLVGAGCATVPAGYAGVLLTSSGVVRRPLGEGITAVSPLSHVELYDLRAQARAEDLKAVAADGAPLIARASLVGFHVAPSEVVALDREVGPGYYERVVRPAVQSVLRRVLAMYRSEQITAAAIRRLEQQITAVVSRQLRPFHVIVDSVDIRNLAIDYSPATYGVILATGVLEQQTLAIPQMLAIARAQADRQREVARGTAAQHRLVAPGLTAETLAHAAHRAVGDLFASPSTNVVSGTGATTLEVK